MKFPLILIAVLACSLLAYSQPKNNVSTFPESKNAWKEYLKNNLGYPEEAKKAGKYGTVFVEYNTDKNGYVTNILVRKSLDSLLDREAMRVISTMPQRQPDVPHLMRVPISFGVDDTKEFERKADSVKKARLERMNVLTKAERMPSYPGGNKALNEFLEDNLKYSKSALKDGKSISVLVEFIVNPDGSLSYIGIKRSVNSQLDAEAMRVVSMMPKWNPGKNNGEPVAVYYLLPVFFKGKGGNSANTKGRNKRPEFSGGEQSMEDFIEKNMKYPKSAKEDSIEGRVFVDFIIDTNGRLSDVGVLKSVDSRLDEEAVRIVNNMPKWKCGISEGKPTAMRYAIPIDFSLNGKKDKEPSFPGGKDALIDYLDNNISYPFLANLNAIHGRVVVSFTVKENGKISDVEVTESIHPSLDKEVVRAIKSMPKWNPGMKDGQPVSQRFFLPVTFHIDGDSNKWKDGKKNGHFDFDSNIFFQE